MTPTFVNLTVAGLLLLWIVAGATHPRWRAWFKARRIARHAWRKEELP